MAVRGELDAVGKAGAQIVHQLDCAVAAATANEIGHGQLRVGVDRGPGPHVAGPFRRGLRGRDVLLLGVAERPNLVALDAARLHIVHRFVVNREAGFPRLDEQLRNRVDRHVRHAADRKERAFKFRFRDPMMQPYVIMRGIEENFIPKSALSALSFPAEPELEFPSEP